MSLSSGQTFTPLLFSPAKKRFSSRNPGVTSTPLSSASQVSSSVSLSRVNSSFWSFVREASQADLSNLLAAAAEEEVVVVVEAVEKKEEMARDFFAEEEGAEVALRLGGILVVGGGQGWMSVVEKELVCGGDGIDEESG